MWGANHIGPALHRVSSYYIEYIITLASFISQDMDLQESINEERELPDAQSYLLAFADAKGMVHIPGITKVIGMDDSTSTEALDQSPYHPTSRAALLYALVCKSWYHVAQPLVFRHLRLDDRCNWTALAQRLAQPVCMGVSGIGPLCGRKAASLVRWLDVNTSNFTDQNQVALAHMLVHMDGLGAFALKTTSDSESPTDDFCTVLTSQSTFIALLSAASAKAAPKLKSFALTASMEHSAVRPLLATISTFLHAETIIIRHDIVLDRSMRVLSPQDRFVLLPRLRNFLYQTLRGGNYPLLSHIGRWNTPAMTSLIMISRIPLIGGGLTIFRNIRQLEILVVPCAYFYPEASVPRTDTLSHLIIHYCHIVHAFPVTYTNLSYIGLRGRIYYVKNGRLRLDLSALSSLMRRFAKGRVFPQLQTIQLLDVESAELFDYTWELKEGMLWCCWLLALQDAAIAFVDKHELHLRMVPPHVFPHAAIAPSRALLNRWLTSFARTVMVSERIEADVLIPENVVFVDDSETETDTDTTVLSTPDDSDGEADDIEDDDEAEVDDDDDDDVDGEADEDHMDEDDD